MGARIYALHLVLSWYLTLRIVPKVVYHNVTLELLFLTMRLKKLLPPEEDSPPPPPSPGLLLAIFNHCELTIPR